MNPYEQPNSDIEKQPEARGGIQWLTIIQAVTIFLVTSLLVRFIERVSEFGIHNPTLIDVGIALAPWPASTIFLASRVGYRWDLHAFIYSVTLALSVFASNGAQSVYSGQDFLTGDPLKAAWMVFMCSMFVTVIVIPVSRMILNFVRKTKSNL